MVSPIEEKTYTVKIIHVYHNIKATNEEAAIDLALNLSYGEANDCQIEVEED